MTVLPESFPFPSPHSFSLLLVETEVSPSGVVRRGGVVVLHLRERPCGAGVPLVPLAWLRHVSSSAPQHLVEERGGRRERGGKEKKGGERRGGKMGVKVRGGREVYAARACAGKYTPAPRLNALLMRSGLCPLRIGNER